MAFENRFVPIQAVFLWAIASLRRADSYKRSFGRDKERVEFEELEKACREIISRVLLLTCESELLKHGDGIKALSSAAMAVRESILTFLALVNSK